MSKGKSIVSMAFVVLLAVGGAVAFAILATTSASASSPPSLFSGRKW